MELQISSGTQVNTLRKVSVTAAVLVVAIGVLVMGGWLLDIHWLKVVPPGQSSMKFNTALAFALGGLGLFGIERYAWITRWSAVFLILLGMITLGEYFFGWSPGIDRWFVVDTETPEILFPGRMSITSAVNFLLIGTSTLFLCAGRLKAGQALALAVAVISFVSLSGYLYEEKFLRGVGHFTPMAFHTAIAFLLFGVALLYRYPQAGFLAVVTSDYAGGLMARRVLPAAIIVPLLLEWARLKGQQANLYDTNYGLAISVVSSISVFTVLIYWNARRLNHLDLQRSQAMESLRQSNEELECRVMERTRDLTRANDELTREINERRLVEQALRRNEETLQAMFDLLPVGASVMTNEREVVRVNAALQKIIPIDANELASGRNDSVKYIRGDGSPLALTELPSVRAIAEQQPIQDVEIGIVGEEAPIIWTSVSAAPLPQQQGAIVVTVDITERKRTETVLMRTNERLQQANDEIQQFAYIVTHDLRTPLINLKGFSDIVRKATGKIESLSEQFLPAMDETSSAQFRNAVYDEIPTALRFINTSIERLDGFTSAILNLSRLGRYQLNYEQVALQPLVHRILESLAAQIAENNIQVEVDSLPDVPADRIVLDQIMGNIVTNAVKYLDPGRPGRIRIYAEQDAVNTTVHVEDNGRGISESEYDRVFAPFRRAGRPTVEGEGMGLAYVQALVRRHQGRIWFTSTLDVGTTFSFTIPHQRDETA